MLLPLSFVLALSGAPPAASGMDALAPLHFLDDGNYGPVGYGPHWSLSIEASGHATFHCTQWLCSSGRYDGQIASTDLALLLARIQDLRSVPSLPVCCGADHAPSFMFFPARIDFVVGTCVSLVHDSPLRWLYDDVVAIILRTSWAQFRASPERPLEAVSEAATSPCCLARLPVSRTYPLVLVPLPGRNP